MNPRLLALLMVVLITLWVIRYAMVRHSYQVGDKVRVSGQISNQPQIMGAQQRISLGDFTFYTDRFPEIAYGERIIAEGVVGKGKSGYYLESPVVKKIGELGVLGEIRESVFSVFKKFLPEPHSGLLSGVVLGTKSSLDSNFLEGLRKTGTLHIVVASGSNIAFFSGLLINITAFIWGRKRAVLLCFILVWSYVLLIGADPPIVRAAVMGSILIFAQSLGREFDVWRALAIAGAVMLFIYPLWLFDLGFQLSFLATAGIVGLGKKTEGLVDKIKYLPAVFKSALSVTLAAQVAVTPLLFITFGEVSLVGPLVNMLVLWTVPFIMLGGFLLGILGVLGGLGGTLSVPGPALSAGEVLGQILAWFLWLPLEYFIQIVRLFGK